MLVFPYPTKKHLIASIGQPLRYRETSMFGAELERPGFNTGGGPSDYHTWYAKVEIDVDGVILSVDGKRTAGVAPAERGPLSAKTMARKAKEAAVRRAFYGGRDPMSNAPVNTIQVTGTSFNGIVYMDHYQANDRSKRSLRAAIRWFKEHRSGPLYLHKGDDWKSFHAIFLDERERGNPVDPYSDPAFPMIYPETVKITMKRGHGKYKGEKFFHDFGKGVEQRKIPAGSTITAPTGETLKIDHNAVVLRNPGKSVVGKYPV